MSIGWYEVVERFGKVIGMFCNVLVILFLTLCVVQYKLSGYAASRNYGFIFGSGVFCSCDERAPKPCCGSVKGRDLLVGNEGPSTHCDSQWIGFR